MEAQTLALALKARGIKVLSVSESDQCVDGEVQLEHNVHIQVNGVCCVNRESGEGVKYSIHFGPERKLTEIKKIVKDIKSAQEQNK